MLWSLGTETPRFQRKLLNNFGNFIYHLLETCIKGVPKNFRNISTRLRGVKVQKTNYYWRLCSGERK